MIVKTLHATANIATLWNSELVKTLVSEKCMVTELSCECNIYFLTVLVKVSFVFAFANQE